MINEIKEKIKQCVENKYQVKVVVEEPKDLKMGDLAVPVFPIVKVLRKPLNEVALEVAKTIKENISEVKDTKVIGGFVNLVLSKEEMAYDIIKSILTEGSNYASKPSNDEVVCLDYSSPNIAKSFSIGHLRSTIIGNSLKLIYQKLGYKTVSINYLGDWGTQFGKMIVAYLKWGDKEKIKQDPINEMTNLYVKFHEEAKKDESLNEEARQAFRKCELGDKEYLELWRYIREESLKESAQIYDLLGVTFDSYNGEAFYNDKMDGVVEELEAKHLVTLDDNALIVRFADGMPPALIKRSDGGSLYMTRDLAALLYRKKEYNFKEILYVVGNEQKLHFEQIKAIIKMLGYDFSDEIKHVGFGLYLTNGKKMSTRSGGVVKLYDVLMKAISLAKAEVLEKNKDLTNKDEVAKKIGLASVIYNDLKNHRELDIEFDLDSCVKFEGNTGPYILYSGVRIASILKDKEIDLNNIDLDLFNKDIYYDVVRQLANFSVMLNKAKEEYAPSYIAKYLYTLATTFNRFYALEKINCEDELIRNTNFALIKAIRIVLNEGLRLLGIAYVDEM